MDKKIHNRTILGGLILLFIGYNIVIYTQNTSNNQAVILSPKAQKGEHLWQENNCTACHQLYGLGGYLGPDLTNIASNPNKGIDYAKAFFNSGVKSMPQFNFSTEEQNQIAAFLTEVDKTGFYPDRNAIFESDGWVTVNYK
ncbi:MAG: cytochrome c [Fluviicola sp.]|nr:cytochrome c [Fluviicola sp.]